MAKTFSWNLQYQDSTPKLNVMHSAFEHWFQAQPFATQSGIKQIARDSYAAGMGDPLVTYAEDQGERKCNNCGDKLMSDMTTLCYACSQELSTNKTDVLSIKGNSGDTLADFSADQWWVKELEAIAIDTHDQKRAIAVLHNLLETITHVPK